MRKGRNSGKKLMAARIVKHTLEIIHLLTDQNPVQVCQHTYIRGVCCVCVCLCGNCMFRTTVCLLFLGVLT